MRAPTLTLGQSDSNECLVGTPTPRRIAFNPSRSDDSVGRGTPNQLASPVQPPLHMQQSQASLASTLQYKPASPAPTACDGPSGTPVTVSSDVLLPDNQLGDSQLYPSTPTSTTRPAVAPEPSPKQATSTTVLSPQQVVNTTPPPPPPPTPPPTPEPSQTALQATEQTQPSTQQSSTPAPEQTTQSSSSASTAPDAKPAVELEGTMYTDGTYWKILDCIGIMLWDSLLNWFDPNSFYMYSKRSLSTLPLNKVSTHISHVLGEWIVIHTCAYHINLWAYCMYMQAYYLHVSIFEKMKSMTA